MPDLLEDMVTICNEITPGLVYANNIINNDNKFVNFMNTTNENLIIPENFIPTMTPYKTITSQQIFFMNRKFC